MSAKKIGAAGCLEEDEEATTQAAARSRAGLTQPPLSAIRSVPAPRAQHPREAVAGAAARYGGSAAGSSGTMWCSREGLRGAGALLQEEAHLHLQVL